jgi:large subunit ribosomal protein L24
MARTKPDQKPEKLPRMDIRKGDEVYLLTGGDRARQSRLEEVPTTERQRLSEVEKRAEAERRPGVRGKVIGVLPRTRQVLVDGVNMITKHARATGRTTRAAQMQTGRIQQPGPIHISNVMLVCPRCQRPTRVWRPRQEASPHHAEQKYPGKPIRICQKCKEYIDEV